MSHGAVAQTYNLTVNPQQVYNNLVLGAGSYPTGNYVVDGNEGNTRLILDDPNEEGSITVTNGATLTFQRMPTGSAIMIVGSTDGSGGPFLFEAVGVNSRISFRNNTAGDSVVYNRNATTTFKGNIDFTGNTSIRGDAVVYNDTSPSIVAGAATIEFDGNTTFSDNKGWAVYNSGSVNRGATINFNGITLFERNENTNIVTSTSGAAIIVTGAHSLLNFNGITTFRENKGSSDSLSGGGAAIYSSDVGTNKSNILSFIGTTTFEKNSARHRGGAIDNLGSIFTFEGETIFNNNNVGSTSTGGGGGAIRNSSGIFTFREKTTFIDNNSNLSSTGMGVGGGAIRNETNTTSGTLNFFDETTFRGNNTNRDGGAITNDHATLNFTGTTNFFNNTAGRHGGAIYSYAVSGLSSPRYSFINLTVTDENTSTFLGNSDSVVGDTFERNSIHFGGSGGIHQFEVNTVGNGRLEMYDPMRSVGTSRVDITKTGTGTWQLAGNNVFTSTGNVTNVHTFDVQAGTFHLITSGLGNPALNLGNGRFDLQSGATLRSDKGSSISTQGALALHTGSLLEYDLRGVTHNETMLFLAGQITVNSHVNVLHRLSELSLQEDEWIVLVQGPDFGYTFTPGVLQEEGTSYFGREYHLVQRDNQLLLVRQHFDPSIFTFHWAAGNGTWNYTDENWADAESGTAEHAFEEWSHAVFGSTAAGSPGRVTIQSGGVRAGSVNVIHDGYTFDLRNGGMTAVEEIHFGTATLLSGIGTTISAGGAIILQEGSSLEFDLSSAAHEDTMLSLTGANVAVLSDIVAVLNPTLTSGQYITLVDTNIAGAVANAGDLYVDGELYAPERGGSVMYGLSASPDDSQLLFRAVSGLGTTTPDSPLLWTGIENNRWDINTSKNWDGIVNEINVKTFINGDTVVFDNTANRTNRNVTLAENLLRVNSMTVSGSDYVFNMATGSIEAAGNIDFGTATLEVRLSPEGTNITSTSGSVNLAPGSRLVYDLTSATDGSTLLTLNGAGITVSSSISVSHLTLTSGQVTLINANRNGAVAGVDLNNWYLDGELYTPQRSLTPGDIMYALTTNAQLSHLYLQAVSAAGNSTDLVWTGETGNGLWDIHTSRNWLGTVNDVPVYTFLNGDSVSFTNAALAENRNVTIVPGGVEVNTMSVMNGTGYTFNLMVENVPAIESSGFINLGNAVLNITGYVPGDPNPYTGAVDPVTVIRAGGRLSNFNPAVTVSGQASADYLSASAFQDGNDIKVETRLTWYSTDPTRPAHGDFTVNSGEFTLGAVLANNTASANRRNDWSGTSLTKLGDGTLILIANNTYTGRTTVAGGTLIVGNVGGESGRVAGAVEVLAGAMLGGHGRVGGLTVQSGGTLSPGISSSGTPGTTGERIGTLTVNNGGDVVFESGSTFLFQIDKENVLQNTDRLVVIGGGTVGIAEGARLEIEFLHGGTVAAGDRFQVIGISNGSAAQFTGTEFFLTGQSVGLRSLIDDTGYWLVYQPPPRFEPAIRYIGTPNAIRAAEGTDRLFYPMETDLMPDLYQVLEDMLDNPYALAEAFAQLHGEVFAANKEAAARMQRRFLRNLPSAESRLMGVELSEFSREEWKCKWNRWGTLTGDIQGRKNIDLYSGYDLKSQGVAFGMDRLIAHNSFFGIAVGYDNTSQDFRTIRSHNQLNALRMAVHGGWWNGKGYVEGYAGYTMNFHKTRRKIDIDTFSATARSEYNDNMFSTGIEIGRRQQVGSATYLTPSIGFHYIHLASPGVTETGAGDANLHIRGHHYNSLRLPIGMKLSRDFAGENGIIWTPEGRAHYIREFGDDSVWARTSYNNARRVSFLAGTDDWGENSIRLGMGLNMRLSDRLNFRFDYDHEAFSYMKTNEFSATLGVQW